jgi:two-component system, OmpR family, response regulator MtrA
MTMIRVLIVEDDQSLRELVRLGLEGEGFQVFAAADGPSGLDMFEHERPDLVLLDIMLPGLDGFEVCRRIRQASLTPIIMLTARSSTVDVVVGLESGADDYVTKPFEFPELVARIRSVLRRAAVVRPLAPGPLAPGPSERPERLSQADSAVLVLGPLMIDTGAHSVRRGGEELPLTVTEFRLLYELTRHAGQVLTREQLLELVWGYTYMGDSRLVDVHVQRLRAKIEESSARPTLIQTVRGVGYRAQRHGA